MKLDPFCVVSLMFCTLFGGEDHPLKQASFQNEERKKTLCL